LASQINASNSGFGGIVSTGDSSGVLQLQTAGTTALTIDTSQRAAFVAGTAALPAITTTGDTNTGMWFPAADTIAFAEGGTEAMRLDSSGNVGIGTTSPTAKLSVGTLTETVPATYTGVLKVQGSAQTTLESVGGIELPVAGDGYSFKIQQLSASGAALVFANRNASATWTERMRITSAGDVFINATSYPAVGTEKFGVQGSTTIAAAFTTVSSTNPTMFVNNSHNGSSTLVRFSAYQGQTCGNITTNGSTTTTYSTSSDYRLKENIAPITGALDKVSQLKPVTYKWKQDGSDGQGFIAHELAEVVPDCVVGEKDAVETYTDEDGIEQTRIKPQGVDTSFLVATLTAAIQEQQTIINDLKARIETLEAR
jgi:hypothetical protein